MELGWKNARPDARPEGEKTKPNTSYSGQGLEIKEKFLHFRSRAKNVLDIPSYRSGDSAHNRSVMSIKAMFQQLSAQMWVLHFRSVESLEQSLSESR